MSHHCGACWAQRLGFVSHRPPRRDASVSTKPLILLRGKGSWPLFPCHLESSHFHFLLLKGIVKLYIYIYMIYLLPRIRFSCLHQIEMSSLNKIEVSLSYTEIWK